jgi:hypothetical protein
MRADSSAGWGQPGQGQQQHPVQHLPWRGRCGSSQACATPGQACGCCAGSTLHPHIAQSLGLGPRHPSWGKRDSMRGCQHSIGRQAAPACYRLHGHHHTNMAHPRMRPLTNQARPRVPVAMAKKDSKNEELGAMPLTLGPRLQVHQDVLRPLVATAAWGHYSKQEVLGEAPALGRVSMHACIHICLHIHMLYTYMYACIYTCMHVCIHTCMQR